MLEILNSKTVLIVEDDEEYAKQIENILQIYFGSVFVCHDTSSAEELLNKQYVDIIFSDIHLGNDNGLDFIEKIRKTNSDVVVVVISSLRYEELLLRAIGLGLTAYLIKPISFDSLLEILTKCALTLSDTNPKVIHIKDNIYYDKSQKSLIIDAKSLILNKRECLFVELLLSNKSGILTKETIALKIWQSETISDAVLRNYIFRLRKRFGKDFIYTVSDIGYSLFNCN